MVGVLLNGDPTALGAVSIDLFSNRRSVNPFAPNAPGSFLLQLGTVSDASLSSSSADFFFFAAYPLAPNTRYWIQVAGTNAFSPINSANWAWSLDQTALGVAGEFWGTRNGVSSNVSGPYQ